MCKVWDVFSVLISLQTAVKLNAFRNIAFREVEVMREAFLAQSYSSLIWLQRPWVSQPYIVEFIGDDILRRFLAILTRIRKYSYLSLKQMIYYVDVPHQKLSESTMEGYKNRTKILI